MDSKKTHRPLWRRLLKWISISVIIVLLLLASIMGIALLYLTPERLTPLVNKYAGDYLNADVYAGRVELTFWSTFPRLDLQIDSLTVVSHSLDRLSDSQRASLPQDADSLLSVRRFSGGVHLLKIISGTIELYDVQFTQPRLNLFVANDSINNFDILPPSEPSEEPAVIPRVTIDRFAINGDMPIRFRAPADSIDFTLTLHRTALTGADAPAYTIGLAGRTSARMADMHLPETPFSVDGTINWDVDHPELLGLKDFTVSLLNIPANFSAVIEMADTLSVNTFDISIPEIRLGDLIRWLPDDKIGSLSKLQTDMSLALKAGLTRPYRPAIDSIPSADVVVGMSATKIKYEHLDIHSFSLDLHADVDGKDLNRSVVNLRRLSVAGRAMDFTLKADVNSPLRNPLIDMDFSGSLTINRLPSQLLDSLPVTVSGRLDGEASGRFRLNDLTPDKFYRARLDGNLTLSDFSMAMRDGSFESRLNRAVMRLGSHSRIPVGEHLVDSLLTASLSVDTASVTAPGITLSGKDMAMNVGMRNVASSSDTSQINPVGGSLRAGMLSLTADSGATVIRLRDASVGGALMRYNRESRSPLLSLRVDAGRVGYRSTDLMAALRNGHADITLHPRARRLLSARMQHLVDSLAAVYPDLSSDSLTVLARRSMPRRTRVDDRRENIDFGIDNSLAAWLRLWQANGSLTAERAALYTPCFPTRNVARDIDMDFSTDSIIFRHAFLRSGMSDFTLDGSVRNIRRAMTSRGRVPLEIDLNLRSDTIEVNDIMATLLRGAAYSGALDSSDLDAIENMDVDDAVAPIDEVAATEAAAAVIVPSNVRANFSMRASRIHYGDVWFRDFTGNVSVYDGAVALDRLLAATDIGRLSMTALYSAPTPDEIRFAAGVNMKKLDLSKILHEMPQIDSIMPMLKDVSGIVDANLAITTQLDSLMNIRFNSLDMSLQLSGDSLVLLDSETFRTVAKWMMFKNKQRNMIDHMDVEITVREGWLDLYPVIFDMDRYRIGVVGNNDLDFNLDYHVAVLKSPLPFKFGINIKGTPENMKIRLGKARINEKSVASSRHLTDSLRVNLIKEITDVFRRGVRTAGSRGLRMQEAASHGRQSAAVKPDDPSDALNAADSVIFIKEGLMEAPEGFVMPETEEENKKSKK